jgi:hypothetical protein
MNGEEFVAELNVLAGRIPPKAFSTTDAALDCVAYAIVFRGAAPVEYERDKRAWTIQNGTVVYVGEGKRGRATAQFKARGKVVGYVGKEFDHFIAAHWPNFESYLAAANITKPVALEFERILIETFAPPFNESPPRSSWWGRPQGNINHRADMHPARLLPFDFSKGLPRHTHQSRWDDRKKRVDGKDCWEEIPGDWIITRRSLRQKDNQTNTRAGRENVTHFKSYPNLNQSTTVAEHRARNEAAGLSWKHIKAILHYDNTYIDAEGPIITMTPPSAEM